MKTTKTYIPYIKHKRHPIFISIWKEPYRHKYAGNQYILFNTVHKVILDKKVKQFRYNLLNKILPINDNLYQWKIKDSP